MREDFEKANKLFLVMFKGIRLKLCSSLESTLEKGPDKLFSLLSMRNLFSGSRNGAQHDSRVILQTLRGLEDKRF